MDDSYFYSFPTGYRFRPTHEDLIFHYLMKKVKGEPLPPHRIFDVDLYQYHPEDLTKNYKLINEEAWYFFTSRDRKYPNGSRPNRSAGDGSWKPTGIPIRIGQYDEYTGWRRSLDYYVGSHKGEESKRTKWKMIEYTVKIEANSLPNNINVGNGMQLDKWVLCKIYEKVTSKKDEDDNNTQNTQSDQRNPSTSPSVSNHDSSPRTILNSLDVHENQLEATTSTTLNHTHVYHKPLQIRHFNPSLGSTYNFYSQSYHNLIDSSPKVVPNSLDVHGNHLEATTSTTLNHIDAYHKPLLVSTCNLSNQSNYNMIDFSPKVAPNSLDVHENHLGATTSTTLNHAHVYHKPPQIRHFNPSLGSTYNSYNQSYHNLINSSPRVVPNSLDVHGNHLEAATSTTSNHTHAYHEPLLVSTCNFSNQSNYNMIDSSPRVAPNSLDVHENHLRVTTSTTLNHAHVYYEPLQTQHFNSSRGSINNFPNQSPVNYNMKMTTLNHTKMSSSSKQPPHVREEDPLAEAHEINNFGSKQEQQDDLSKMTSMATNSHELPTHARKYEPPLPEVHEDNTFGSKQKQQDYLSETGDIINDWILSDSDFDIINLDSSNWLLSDSDFDMIDLDFSDIFDDDNHKPNT